MSTWWTTITTSQRQGQLREGLSEGSPRAKVRADGQKSHRRLSLRASQLRAGVLVGDFIQATELGTPQGSPLSPLLANILLDDLDKELERRGHRFVRYADDLRILVRSQRAGERVKTSVTRFLTGKLKLTVNEQKSRVVETNDCEFLGFTFRGTARQAHALRSRLDELFRHLGLLPAHTGDGCVAASAYPHVLLETVALGAHQGPPSSGVGNE